MTGRRSKYQSHVEPKLFQVECWARDGLTDEQIARNLGVAYSTFKDYKIRYPALADALKKGKEVVDYEVENALLKRALGYEYLEEKVEVEKDAAGGVIQRKVVRTNRHVPPDVGAAAFWLKNRRPDKWRDRPAASMDDGVLPELIEELKRDAGG